MRYRIEIVVILLAAALLAAACGPGGGGQPGGGAPGGPGQGGGPAGTSTVAVTEKEWAITVGAVQAGAVTFSVKNDGAVEHNFVVKETGARLDGIQPGQTKELTATLQPGTYTILCDIAGHEEAGMHTTITVK
jgi:heme/copper-type cytochrome/quinol oxidase subunit 2